MGFGPSGEISPYVEAYVIGPFRAAAETVRKEERNGGKVGERNKERKDQSTAAHHAWWFLPGPLFLFFQYFISGHLFLDFVLSFCLGSFHIK